MKQSMALVFVLAMVLCACSPGETATPSTLQNDVDNGQGAISSEGFTYTSEDGSLWVTIISPQDGDSFEGSEIAVNGQAPLDTVLTINDGFLYLDQAINFSYPLSLQEGANLIEIIASNSAGTELDILLTVYYEP